MPGTTENHAASRASDSRIEEIRAYVADLLTKPAFAASGRRGQLLHYLVQHTLRGDADKVNEYAIGLDVFDKPTSFDPRIESVVRTEFSRLRQKLKDYYAEEGRGDRIVIDFPPRSYAAAFTFRNLAAEAMGAPQLVPAASKPATRVSVWVPAAALAVVVAIGALAGFALWNRHAMLVARERPIHSIVVLPFENYSPGHQDEYMADGMTEELTNDLAQLRDLRVVARTSAFAFKGKGEDVRTIGQLLTVDAVLEGSFTKEGDQVRITAQLNRTADGYHLWSHSYETESNDLLAVQQDVANAIADQIRRIQGGPAPVIRADTASPEAHDLYLQGVYQLYLSTPESTGKAVQLFQKAIDLDPSFARAYLAIGDAEMNLVTLTSARAAEAFPKIRAATQKAIDLDPNLSEAWGNLALANYSFDWNWTRAEEEFRRAVQLGADAGTREDYGWSLMTRGRFAEAHEQLRLAEEQDPLSVGPLFDEFYVYNFERNTAGEKDMLAEMQRVQPNFLGVYGLNVVTSVQQRDCGTARREADWAGKNYPQLPVTQSILAFAAACEGNRAETLRHIAEMTRLGAPAYQVAIAWAMIGDADHAIAELGKSADAHEGQILYLRYDPFFDGIRSDPRYVALEKRVGLL
jgi:TolB-like protein